MGSIEMRQLRDKAKKDYPYWLLLPKGKSSPNPPVEAKKGYDFIRLPYDSDRNVWCFKTAHSRAKFQSEHGGQEYNLNIPKSGE